MTPAVFSVTADTLAAKVIEEMVRMNVHQLFVVDEHGTLVGSVSALDVLRRLHAE
jgi:CBS-domain-containing membrane protein